jgi:translocation and assembly module TamB
MSLGGGVVGSVKLGKATASVIAENDQVAINNLSAEVMEGKIDGNATIALNDSRLSDIKANFVNLNLGKLLAMQGGRVIPIEGNTTGKVDLTFNGTNFKEASGTLTADIEASAKTEDNGFIPLTGRVAATATKGIFDLDYARLNTANTSLNATGKFDLNGDGSDLTLALNSSKAGEIVRIIRTLNLSPTLEDQLDTYQADFAGNFVFNGKITGNISDPLLDGRASLDSIILRDKDLGSLATNILVTPTGLELRDGTLQERDGGNITFNVIAPSVGTNNIAVQAKLNNISTGNILSALPIKSLPDSLKNLKAKASGNLDLRGLPNEMQGEANISAKDGSVNGQTFDTLETRAIFDGNLVKLETFEAKFGNGLLTGNGFYRTDSTEFDFDVKGNDIPVERVLAFFPKNDSIPEVEGNIDLTAKATGRSSDTTSYNVRFKGVGQDVVINNNSFGNVSFEGNTVNQILSANFVARIQGQPLNAIGSLNFANPDLPLQGETTLNKTNLAPLIAIFRKPDPDSVALGGTATGKVLFAGNLSQLNDQGERVFTTDDLSGTGEFSQFNLQIDETPLIATNPIRLKFDPNAIELLEPANFSGGGSNVVVSGTKALSASGTNNLSVDGKINLRILNAISENIFFSGLANVAVRLTGPNDTARLNGTGQLENGSASTFVGSQRITFERLKGNILFTTNQVQVEQVTGFLGGGKVTASGGILLNGLSLQRFRIDVRGNSITAPLPKDFITTGNADIEISGKREGRNINAFISGQFIATRSVYRKDIDLADLISGRTDRSLSTGTGTSDSSILGTTNLDIRIIGRNAFVVRNNLADLTASADLRVTGDVDFPQVSGRITADSGTIFFRDNRYEVQRGVLTFPPNTNGIDPIINLQAETDIKGYQIFLNLNGSLSDTESLRAVTRSNPALPQDDVLSLITTGNLADSDKGLLGSGGVNTVAGVLTDEIINKPLSRATDKLFGLNRFELDPIVSGQRGNPTARLTVGRQINKNLLVTYSTNLSEDQNQVLALEYRVSNRLSLVAQYEQRSLSNVTQNRNNFSFEVRLRKRF